MLQLLVMFVCFAEAVMIHLMLCRRHTQPGLLLKPFIGIALVNLIVLWFVYWLLDAWLKTQIANLWTLDLKVSITLLYLLMIPAYLVFYFSTDQMSPTKKILLLLSQHGPLTLSDLSKHFSNEEFIFPRLHELKVIGSLVEHSGWYVLTPSGLKMAKIYKVYQGILGRPKGG